MAWFTDFFLDLPAGCFFKVHQCVHTWRSISILRQSSKIMATHKGNQVGISLRWTYDYVGVSKNMGTPKSSILIGFSLINHPFWGTPIFGNTHVIVEDWAFFITQFQSEIYIPNVPNPSLQKQKRRFEKSLIFLWLQSCMILERRIRCLGFPSIAKV